ncbi:MAG TPA: 4Fe-4S binding protein [Nanoarchaeota archaeon]|nr:4Fe-4S binding protein [Nanoarchaeota archaeon]
MAKYEIIVHEGCIGCGNCEAVCPKSFKLKDCVSHPVKRLVEKLACEKEAEEQCPVQVIEVKEAK